MEIERKWHLHPEGSGEKVDGHLLEHKDELRKGDVYSDRNGEWVEIPDVFVECPVPKVSSVMYVRPADDSRVEA